MMSIPSAVPPKDITYAGKLKFIEWNDSYSYHHNTYTKYEDLIISSNNGNIMASVPSGYDFYGYEVDLQTVTIDWSY